MTFSELKHEALLAQMRVDALRVAVHNRLVKEIVARKTFESAWVTWTVEHVHFPYRGRTEFFLVARDVLYGGVAVLRKRLSRLLAGIGGVGANAGKAFRLVGEDDNPRLCIELGNPRWMSDIRLMVTVDDKEGGVNAAVEALRSLGVVNVDARALNVLIEENAERAVNLHELARFGR